MIRTVLCLFSIVLPGMSMAAESMVQLEKAPLDFPSYPAYYASLQRGAQIYVNNCLGCHSVKYMRYDGLAKGIEIVDEEGEVLKDVVKEKLMFTGEKLTDSIQTSMPAEDSAVWFGVAPPDLSLVARSRGVDWLYTYMKSFYKDEGKPWGVNNLLFPDVAMPHVLVGMEGVKTPVYRTIQKEIDGKMVKEEVIDHLVLDKAGQLDEKAYDQAVTDLVNFLDYVGEPAKMERKRIGVWVLLFLGIFFMFSFLLKKEYWKDIK